MSTPPVTTYKKLYVTRHASAIQGDDPPWGELENEIHPVVRIPSPPADPPPIRRATRPDPGPSASTNRCGAAQRSLADAHPDRESESEDPQRDKRAEQLLRSLDVAPEDTPVVIWHGEKVLRNPTNAELARTVGLPVPDADAATVSARL